MIDCLIKIRQSIRLSSMIDCLIKIRQSIRLSARVPIANLWIWKTFWKPAEKTELFTDRSQNHPRLVQAMISKSILPTPTAAHSVGSGLGLGVTSLFFGCHPRGLGQLLHGRWVGQWTLQLIIVQALHSLEFGCNKAILNDLGSRWSAIRVDYPRHILIASGFESGFRPAPPTKASFLGFAHLIRFDQV